ncbi:MAG: AmmeMemoRadiSam system radical SAM enzyme [Armatimonadota bacterium]
MKYGGLQARHWQTRTGYIECLLCPWHCHIRPGQTGRCHVRRNEDGVLRPLTYGRVAAINVDPIEKKPLYHFCPGSAILSLGSWGCNLSCTFCQNWQISQDEVPTHSLSPEDAVSLAEEARSRGNIGIAYTYNEPMIWFEYVYDTAWLAHEPGLKNVLVTNGIVEVEPLEELLPLIDAMNVDIKSMDDAFYRRLCGGEGWPARRTVELAWGHCHVEITNLIVTGENDSEEAFRALADWAAGISPKLPVHVSRYFPQYKLGVPATPLETLRCAREILSEKLQFVYIGNASLDAGSDTVCPECGVVVVKRSGYSTQVVGLNQGRCGNCGEDLNVAY